MVQTMVQTSTTDGRANDKAKMKAKKVTAKEPPPAYQRPKLMNCVARNCDNPVDQFSVYAGGCVDEVPGKAFVFEIRDDLVRRGYHVHSKTGNIYNVLGVLRRPGTSEFFVFYLGKSSASESCGCYWFRSVEDFHKKVKIQGLGEVPRFRYRGF